MSLFDKILGKLGLKKPEEGTVPATQGKVESRPPASQSPASQSPATQRPASSPLASSKTPASSTARPPAPTSQPAQARQPLRAAGQPSQENVHAAPAAVAKRAPMAMVDVMEKLETMAKGTNLDWKVSIVDLLKVLDIDSSLQARKELATELGAPPEVMQDNIKMNVWLHKTVMAKIAENGGNIPKDLLD